MVLDGWERSSTFGSFLWGLSPANFVKLGLDEGTVFDSGAGQTLCLFWKGE